jgi:outer membrane protein assembly factor BamD
MRRVPARIVAAALGVALLAATALSCAGRKKKKAVETPEVSTVELFEKGMDLLNRHELRQATNVLKRVEYTPDTRDEIEPLVRLAIADATFYQGTALALIDARNLYLEFVTMNGDHALAPYAQLQVGQCSLAQVNHPTKDQTETQEAIRELETVSQRWPDSPFAAAARSLLGQARANLAESEYLVGRFYLSRKAYPAAVERFGRILRLYPDFEEMEKVLYHMGDAHLRAGNDVEGRLYLEQIVEDYPDSEWAGPARKALGSD